jgi:hypothetical protein
MYLARKRTAGHTLWKGISHAQPVLLVFNALRLNQWAIAPNANAHMFSP